MELQFSEFDTESRYDTVRVCDGSCCSGSAIIAELSGQLETDSLLYRSTGTALTVEFTSDGTGAESGFQASFVSFSDPTPTGNLDSYTF